jgi:hypothetical protein
LLLNRLCPDSLVIREPQAVDTHPKTFTSKKTTVRRIGITSNHQPQRTQRTTCKQLLANGVALIKIWERSLLYIQSPSTPCFKSNNYFRQNISSFSWKTNIPSITPPHASTHSPQHKKNEAKATLSITKKVRAWKK